ncbi:hypothetical protein DFH08DRAFT_966885 [Mycena albidolilacea]|uniref:Uncharacterized protein n=1 Tax=Mycena albidolilacea TaxID=1033008 RepID=A0AAD6ZMI3_9AGAR|nr:hypothetical protein DFH08DRAFT_966885 [Mycena albidolilacea]
MSTPTSKPADFFLCIPKCEGDGTNWSVYKTVLTPAEVTAAEAYNKELKVYKSGQAIVKQVIASTIPNALFLHVKDTKTAAEL